MNQLKAVQSKTEIFATTTTTSTTTSIIIILSVQHRKVLPWVNATPNKGKEEKEILQLKYIIGSQHRPLTDLVVASYFMPSHQPFVFKWPRYLKYK